MLFLIHCIDRADASALRAATRPAHLDCILKMGAKILIAGPVLAADAQTPVGSVFIMECEDQAQAQRFAREDPYAKAGLFERTTVAPFRRVVFNPPAS
jgi:uncharacterized protein YciI